jgi:glutathione S-transferase
MPKCGGSKPDGSPCQRIVSPSQTFCPAHDPSRAEQRRRAASKAAKSKPNQEVAEIKQSLKALAEGVLEGRVARADAAVVGQVYNVVLRTLELERKIREQEELMERLEELERSKHLWEESGK